jgi:Sulfotransferase family
LSPGPTAFEVPPYPLPARLGLGLWGVASRLGIGVPALDEAGLIAAARRRTGLEHFVDESFRTPMRRLLRSLEEEADLHLLGRSVMRSSVIRALECRLRLENLCDLHEEIAEIQVERPIFIAGLQRTGTTKLHRLLSMDPRLRAISAAEALNPAPLGRPIRDEPGELERRVAIARTAERGMRYMSPSLFAIHPIEAEAPEEDVFLLDATFISGAVDASLHVPAYTKWIREIDQTDAYRYFRRLIALLLWQRQGRYLGKTPHHLENLDALLAVFPDAKIIHTHRDPQKVVPSFSSMMAHAGAMLAKEVDPIRVGRRVFDQTTNSVTRAIEVRDRAPAGAVIDVHYEDLVRDPLKEIRRIYDFVEMDFAPEVAGAMQGWMAANPKHKNGPHRYRLEDFGLEAGELEQGFERYRNRFGVALESS